MLTIRQEKPHKDGCRYLDLSKESEDVRHLSVYEDQRPLLHVTYSQALELPDVTPCLFCENLCIGSGQTIWLVKIRTGQVLSFPVFGYVGSFYPTKDRLYIASCSQLFCLNEMLERCWLAENLAADGILVHEIEKEYLHLSCEMDPPGGWIDRFLDPQTGKELPPKKDAKIDCAAALTRTKKIAAHHESICARIKTFLFNLLYK